MKLGKGVAFGKGTTFYTLQSHYSVLTIEHRYSMNTWWIIDDHCLTGNRVKAGPEWLLGVLVLNDFS